MEKGSGKHASTLRKISKSRKKRPLGADVENEGTKKSCGDVSYNLKIIVPSTTAAAIMGKDGETRAQLQKDACARILMCNDFYPGTSERICVITGRVESIMKALTFILEKASDKTDMPYERTSTEDIQMPGSSPNVTEPVANNSPTGSPFANSGGGGHSTPSCSSVPTASLNSSVAGNGMLLNGGGSSLNLGNPAGGLASATLTTQLLEHIKVTLQGSGYQSRQLDLTFPLHKH